MKKNLVIVNKILPVPWPFNISRLNCIAESIKTLATYAAQVQTSIIQLKINPFYITQNIFSYKLA